MIHLTFDHDRIAELAHSDDAIEWLCQGEPLDWQAILSERETNILVRDDQTDAHALFQFRAPSLWEFHFVAPPNIRGKAALNAAREALLWFDWTMGESSDWTADAALYAKCHVTNRRVFPMIALAGFRYRETRDQQAYFSRI